jgi:hypothetical protein
VLESFNAVTKDHIKQRGTLLNFVEVSMPAFLRYCGANRCPATICGDPGHEQHRLITRLPIPKELLVNAAELVEMKILRQKERDNTIVYFVPSVSHNTGPLTPESVRDYNADPSDNMSFADLSRRYLCLHRVKQVSKVGVLDQFQCDCKMFMQSAYVCSHVLAVYDLVVKDFSLDTCLKPFTGPREGGRPSNAPGALEQDTPAALQGARMVGAQMEGVREHAGKGIAVVGMYYKKDKNFIVSFLHQPAGEREFHIPEEEVREGYKAHKEAVSLAKDQLLAKRKRVV